jgi:hypothetical protein
MPPPPGPGDPPTNEPRERLQALLRGRSDAREPINNQTVEELLAVELSTNRMGTTRVLAEMFVELQRHDEAQTAAVADLELRVTALERAARP